MRYNPNDPTRTLKRLTDEVDASGLEPDSYEYKIALLGKQVTYCQEMRGQSGCENCEVFMFCDIAKQYLVQLKYGRPKRDGQPR
jgi:hypothetical protein